jgi:cobalt-zinc-cadmium resistance protein CzcA
MLRRIILFSLTHRFLILAVAIASAGAGLLALEHMPADVLPSLNAPVVLVVVSNEGLAPQEMEALVARPLESAVRFLPGTEFVQTRSSQGWTILTAQFAWGSDFYRILQEVAAAVGQVQGSFPLGTRPPVLTSATSRLQQIVEYYLSGDLPPRDLREIADYDVRVALLGVSGVQRVLNMGAEVRQYNVEVRLDGLNRYGVDLREVEKAVQRSNVSFAGGFIVTGPQEITVRGIGQLRSLAELSDVRIATVKGRPVLLRDVAMIREGSAIPRSTASIAGTPVVTGTVTKHYGTDTRQVAEDVERTLAALRPQLPPGVSVMTFYSQAELIGRSLHNLRDALFVGGAAVLLVTWILAGDWILALVVAVIMPLSLLATFAVMGLAGFGLDTMSLGGIAVGLGIMIDAAIVDTENIFRRLREAPGDRTAAALEGSLEVRRPVLFSTLIIGGMFIPVFFLGGIAGRIFTPFAFSLLASMIIGYVLSLTVTPVLAATFLRARPESAGGFVLPGMRRAYESLIGGAIRWPALVILAGLGVLALTAWIGSGLGFDFLPPFDEGTLMVKVVSPPGTSLAMTDLQAQRGAGILARAPGVQQVVLRAGQPEGSEDVEGLNNSEIWVRLAPEHPSVDSIRRWIRDSLAAITGARVIITAPLIERIEESLAQAAAPLAVSVVGDNLDTLAAAAERVGRIMARTPGIVDVNPEAAEAVTQAVIEVDRVRAARYGVDPDDIAETVELGYEGRTVTHVLRGQRKEYGVFVRLRPEDRGDVEDLRRLPIAVSGGGHVWLDQVADVSLALGPSVIRRDNGERRVQITANLAGTDLASAVGRIQSGLSEAHVPPGYRVRFGGSYEEQRGVQRSMLIAVVAAIAVIFIILQAAFQSASQAALMILTIPLALSGGLGALWLTGTNFNVSSLIGLLALFGLAIQKVILLIQYANDRRDYGASAEQAAHEAAVVRLRPVLMTTAATALAVLPLALGIGAGAQLQQPMAIVIIGGVVTDTLLTLVLLPPLYRFVARRSARSSENERSRVAA